MKKILKVLSLFLVLGLSFNALANNKEYIDMLKNHSLVVVRNNTIETSDERGLKPLLTYLKTKNFKGAKSYDRMVGRAAALLYVYGEADYVYTDVISKPAAEILKTHNIKYDYKTLVDEVLNRDKTDLCPFEKLVQNEQNPAQAYALILNKIYPNGIK